MDKIGLKFFNLRELVSERNGKWEKNSSEGELNLALLLNSWQTGYDITYMNERTKISVMKQIYKFL